jgi:hypothetical protein
MLKIICPPGYDVEWNYIFSVILKDILGLEWCIAGIGVEDDELVIFTDGSENEIHLPVRFFLKHINWLDRNSLPILPLSYWDSKEFIAEIKLTDSLIPIIYGDNFPNFIVESNKIRLPIDIFGSSFFMLSRYEELVIDQRDEHNRFPASASLALACNFLERPIVDEYIEILWGAIQRLWPQMSRRKTCRKINVTCDVDVPYQVDFSYRAILRGVGNNILKQRNLKMTFENLKKRLRARCGNFSKDLYLQNIDWMMDVNEFVNNKVSFYFITQNTDPVYDGRYGMDEPIIRKLLKKIHDRGHEIGLHPSYNSYNNQERILCEANILRDVLEKENISYSQLGGRQHFLRWDPRFTALCWENAGLQYDSSLCFAEYPGFRCGTSRDFMMYDLVNRRVLNLKQRPLILMECSVISKRYRNLGYTSRALTTMLQLKDRALSIGGEFTVLWHNDHFNNPEDKEFYKAIIRN